MRVWGRVYDELGNYQWVAVVTDTNGQNDAVYVTALAQVLALNLNESPFYANFGIPAHQSVMQRIFPDFYVAFTQIQYSRYFASLNVAKLPTATPHYKLNVLTQSGSIMPPGQVPK